MYVGRVCGQHKPGPQALVRARPAGQSEREAKRKALRALRGGRARLRPYRPEGARSRLISEAKQGRACSVSWMGDHLGIPGPHVLAQGSPIFHSSFKGELGIGLESLQGKIDLI